MEAGDYLLIVVLIVLVVVGLIINPVIAFAFIFFLYIHSKVKKQQSENNRNAEYYKDIQQRKQDAYYNAVNKRVARKEEANKKQEDRLWKH